MFGSRGYGAATKGWVYLGFMLGFVGVKMDPEYPAMQVVGINWTNWGYLDVGTQVWVCKCWNV